MSESPKFRDLVAGAISSHGRASSDLLRRIGSGEPVDLAEEALDCVGQLTQTAARFVMFWDNIATLVAADPGGPLTFPAPQPCPPGTPATLTLTTPGVAAVPNQSGLRRRGEGKESILSQAVTCKVGVDEIKIEVDCGGAQRGVYEGTLDVVDANGAQSQLTYNIYIDPAAQP